MNLEDYTSQFQNLLTIKPARQKKKERKKVSETPNSINKPGMVVHFCDPYGGGIKQRISV
jgi:hypothetical protein